MLLATRQFPGSAGRPAFSQPWRYIGQCEATQLGCRKFAEMGSQPREAAATTPFENGATTVTTIGGCGFWKGVTMTPWPISAMSVRSVPMVQYLPARL